MYQSSFHEDCCRRFAPFRRHLVLDIAGLRTIYKVENYLLTELFDPVYYNRHGTHLERGVK